MVAERRASSSLLLQENLKLVLSDTETGAELLQIITFLAVRPVQPAQYHITQRIDQPYVAFVSSAYALIP